MKSLSQLLANQTLADSIVQLEHEVKAQPADADLRASLVQLFCLSGNWGRAKTQLKPWLALKPIAQPAVTLLTQTIDAEIQRLAVFNGKATPNWVGHAPEWVVGMLQALQADIDGRAEEANQLRALALEAAPLNPGQVNEQVAGADTQRFHWLTDGDGRLGPICELGVNGLYYWLPFSEIAEIHFQAPSGATDLIWRHALVCLTSGAEQVCQIPARYPLSEHSDDDQRLAKTTDWLSIGNSEHFIGLGQKVWLNNELSFPLLTLSDLRFDSLM